MNPPCQKAGRVSYITAFTPMLSISVCRLTSYCCLCKKCNKEIEMRI